MTHPTTTNLVQKTQEELASAHLSEDPVQQGRHRENARIYSMLAGAQATRDGNDLVRAQNDLREAANAAAIEHNQQMRVANIMAYLNSSRETWHEEDEVIIRQLLGLMEIDESATLEPEPEIAGTGTTESESNEF